MDVAVAATCGTDVEVGADVVVGLADGVTDALMSGVDVIGMDVAVWLGNGLGVGTTGWAAQADKVNANNVRITGVLLCMSLSYNKNYHAEWTLNRCLLCHILPK
jgi:hypothetical protein